MSIVVKMLCRADREPGGEVIRLADRAPIASGSFRACYLHPQVPGCCIKVMHDNGRNHRRGILDCLLGVRDRHPNLREWHEYQRLKKRGVPLERYFPAIHGIVNTDLGPGLVVDLLCGVDQEFPLSVQDYVNGRQPEGLAPETVLTEFAVFAGFCVQHGIFASCDEPGNVGFIRTGHGFRFISYDLKLRRNKELIPISTLLPAERRRKVARRFAATLGNVARRLQVEWRPGLMLLRSLLIGLLCLAPFLEVFA